MPKRFWDNQKVITIIKQRHANNLPLNPYHKDLTSLRNAANSLFGSWKIAIEKSGLTYEDVLKDRSIPRKWGKQKVLKAILELFDAGLPLNSNYVQLSEQNLYGAACKYFDGWGQALEAAGFNYSEIRVKSLDRKWSQAAIVREIKRRKKLGLSINGEQVSKDDVSFYHAAYRYFGQGGWKKALLMAGINPKDIDPKRKWTKRIILSRIKKLHKSGAPLYAYALVKAGQGNFVEGARKYFGSWRKAIEAAGLKWKNVRGVKKFNWWTPNRVIARIKYWNSRDVQLSSKFMQANRGDLFGAAVLFFGSWSQAVYAAEINYLAHSKSWSSKAWLRNLNEQDVDDLKTHSIKNAEIGGKNVRNTVNQFSDGI